MRKVQKLIEMSDGDGAQFYVPDHTNDWLAENVRLHGQLDKAREIIGELLDESMYRSGIDDDTRAKAVAFLLEK